MILYTILVVPYHIILYMVVPCIVKDNMIGVVNTVTLVHLRSLEGMMEGCHAPA